LKQYSQMKDSGIEWIGEIPEGWDVKKIKYLLISGKSGIKIGPFGSSLKLDSMVKKGYKVYGQENVIDQDFEAGERFIDQKKFDKLITHEIIPDDIIVTMMGTTGLSKVVPAKIQRGIMDSHLVRVRSNNLVCNTVFLSLLINSSDYVKFQLKLESRGSIMEGLNSSILKSVRILLPKSTNEQKQIASYLDKKTKTIDDEITKNQNLIKLLQEKKESIINHAVTKGLDDTVPMKDSGIEWIGEIPEEWNVKQLKRDTPILRGASPRPIDDPKYFDEHGEYSWVRISDVTASDIFLETTEQKLSVLGSNLSVKLSPKDLFLSIAGSVGKPCITAIPCCIHDGFVYFPRLSMNKKFLFYIFKIGLCFQGLGKLGTQLNLNTETVGSIDIPFPTTNEQKQIASYLDEKTAKIDSLISKIQLQISKLQEFRESLISSAVTGKIKVAQA
jgi:type I restriction enzyme, S subunit